MRLPSGFLLLPALLIVASCTDPVSDVGLDLLEDETHPQAKTASATSFLASNLVDITGTAPRVLVGSVDDPLTGQISANGFLDFKGTFSGESSESITRVQLKLSRKYNFGDTTKAAVFRLHQITKKWDPRGLRSDAKLETGPAILSVTTLDTLTTIDLPDSWVNANESTLKNSNFAEEFHGFALMESGSGQVIGFDSTKTTLNVTASGSSTTYKVSSTYTQIKRMSPSTPPDGLVLFQDGVGPAIRMEFDFGKFKNLPINGAILSFTADTLTSKAAPTNFVRPLPQELQLIAVPLDNTNPSTLIGKVALNDDGEYRFIGRDVGKFFQRVLFGSEDYAYLELRAPVENNSLNAVLLYGTGTANLSPRTTFILSP